MHKGVIMLIQAEDKETALEELDEFMEGYGDGDVWDWWVVGGRWHNTLAPADKLKAFNEEAKKVLVMEEHGFLSQAEVVKKRPQLQKLWEAQGLEGLSPYSNHYDLPNSGGVYDVVPLKDCVDTVKEWLRDMEAEKEEAWQEMVKAREEAKEGKYDMSGYYAGKYKDAQYNNFCFDSNVYNVTTETGEQLPDDVEGYWAIMIDMHN